MLLADLVDASLAVAGTAARSAKRDRLAALLRWVPPSEQAVAVALLCGDARQGRVGVGWATLAAVEADRPAGQTTPTLTLTDVDDVLGGLASLEGPGSNRRRHEALVSVWDRATPAERRFLRAVLTGEVRQGALDGVVTDAVAVAAGVPDALLRRAVMLAGDLPAAAAVALTEGRAGLAAIGLTVGRPLLPMLASPADDLDAALSAPSSVEWKFDGARVQVHRSGADVAVFTRNLNDVTARLPAVVEAVRSLPVQSVVLDGEVLGTGPDDRPELFQRTMQAFGRDVPDAASPTLAPWFFDVLHADGSDLLDAPLSDRLEILDAVAGPFRVPGRRTADPDDARAVLAEALAAGHEGIVLKDLSSPYAAGRRGKAWRKLKPVVHLDLVVLAAEWGHGRRTGWLSNLHLGAADGEGGFVMVGKTFKGLTDELLGWQTEALLAREVRREGIVVHVRPDLVVEVALDGVQRSSRYPGGVALRFARIRRYRTDKAPADADRIGTVQGMLGGR